MLFIWGIICYLYGELYVIYMVNGVGMQNVTSKVNYMFFKMVNYVIYMVHYMLFIW